ncbi:3-hydroxyisobutyrate dehydrogenase [Panacagrimonas perspica]|uniref:3-hydroxyisobutyrate dehydrogenase n=2 Tax=Panacagrimonas perspica TaxID=381431 RepID=A0A4S3K2J3_9GAMM|nr:3-hydroxyisobutyrate dehydrogenase [Panacagrimonas perspica]TDU28975.1 3-hydroxyisobutyrate dehydrogenase [Panacagrimonas perspica]THD02207.1 3-hydroxyisobutyrate dehydrogenase [Panacagrimonas perspica]
MRIAFLGLGNMGAPMAQNLIKAGHELTVFDLVAASVDKLVKDGAKAGRDAADAVRNAEVVVTMLPSSAAVKRLYLGDGGVLAHAAAGALLIDSSTISPDVSREVATAAVAKGFAMIDAPVSGGTAGAAAGTLTFIVGGEAAALERARPLLEKMGKNVFHAGASGAGQIAKICNNMLLGIHMLGTCEAINLGTRLGLDPKVLSDVMAKSSGRNWSLELYNPWPGVMENVPASREYKGGFGTDLMLKDLGLSQEASQSAGVATPLGALTRQLYQLHSGRGYGALDFSSIVDALRAGA